GPAFQQMSGEAMPQDVRRDAAEYARFLGMESQELPEGLAGQGAAAGGNEKETAGAPLENGGAAPLEIIFNGSERLPSDGDDALLVALAGHPEDAEIAVEVAQGDAAQLGDAEA